MEQLAKLIVISAAGSLSADTTYWINFGNTPGCII